MIHTSQSDRIKEERKRLGLTQAQAAEKVGVTRETWGRYETGKLNPGIEVLKAFSDLGIDTDYIINGRAGALFSAHKSVVEYARKLVDANDAGKSIAEPVGSYNDRIGKLIKEFSQLEENGKVAVETMIAALLTNKNG